MEVFELSGGAPCPGGTSCPGGAPCPRGAGPGGAS